MLGGIFKTMPRDSFLVATSTMPKGTDHQNGLFTDATAGEIFGSDIEKSMKRLNVDYLDILFLPFAAKRESVFFEPLLRVMEDFKKQGKARFIGIATHSFVDQAIRAAVDTKIYDVVMAAYNFNIGEHLQAVNDAVAYGASAGLGMIAMKTMAGGYWDKERTQPISSKAALKWVLQNENIHTIMSGMTNFEELQNNLSWLNDPQLNDEDRKELKLAHAGNTGLFCLQCRECDGKCSGNMDIPTIMRSYMYAYGYRNIQHARQTLDYISLTSNAACEQCDVCTVKCKAGFNIRNKIQDIARLMEVPVEFI
jgi:predicted aldo/keto reductase-like oxidoreductase